jgi:hypothetical protein
VPAFIEDVVIDEFGIGPLCPTPRGCIDLVRKNAYSNRDGDVFGVEKGELIFPIKTSRRDRRVRQPVQRNVVQDVIPCEAARLSGEDAYDERLTSGVVVKYPGCEAYGTAGSQPTGLRRILKANASVKHLRTSVPLSVSLQMRGW